MTDCVILKQGYNPKLLLRDYKHAVAISNFTQRKYIKGASVSLYKNTQGWSSIPLHSLNGLDGNQGNILRYIDDKKFQPTEVLKKCTYFQSILQDLHTEVYLVRLMKLQAGGYIAPHNDGNQFKDRHKMIRCHIPIITNNNVLFGIGTQEYTMQQNTLYYTRVDKKHWVKNNSDQDRIHLVIDLKPTLEIMEKIGLTKLDIYKKFYYHKPVADNSIIFQKINTTENPASKICLVMCQWKRYHTLEKILHSIEFQTQKVDVYLWNNNNSEKDTLHDVLSKFRNSNINIYAYDSPYNIKGCARLIVAHILRYQYQNVIFFDDDEIMNDKYVVQTFQEEAHKYSNTILSIWSLDFTSSTNFYKRKKKYENQYADYSGSGGAIYPSQLFSDKFIAWCPEKYLNNEDFLCNIYIATHMNGFNRASKANIKFIEGEYNSKDSMSWGKKYCNRTGIEIHALKNQQLQWSIKKYNYPSKNYYLHKIWKNYSVWKNYNPKNMTLYIVFSDITIKPDFDFYHLFENSKYNILYIRDYNKKYYLQGITGCSTNVHTTLKYLQDKIRKSKCTKIITLGYQGGGYGALLYGNLLNVHKIITFNPFTYLETKITDKLPLEINKTYFNLQNLNSVAEIQIIYDNNFLHHYQNIKHNLQLNITGRRMKIAKNGENLLDYLEKKGMVKDILDIRQPKKSYIKNLLCLIAIIICIILLRKYRFY